MDRDYCPKAKEGKLCAHTLPMLQEKNLVPLSVRYEIQKAGVMSEVNMGMLTQDKGHIIHKMEKDISSQGNKLSKSYDNACKLHIQGPFLFGKFRVGMTSCRWLLFPMYCHKGTYKLSTKAVIASVDSLVGKLFIIYSPSRPQSLHFGLSLYLSL